MSPEELKKIIEAVAKAYEKAGKKITTAVLVDDIKDDEIIGEMLINNRDDKEIN